MSAAATTRNLERERSHVSLLDHDDELAGAVPPEDYGAARRALAGALIHLGERPEMTMDTLWDDEDAWGVYVLSGVVVRALSIGRATLPELVGPGQVLGPPPAVDTVLPVEEHVVAVEATDVVVLGERAARAICRWPALLVVWQQREASRRLRTTTLGAVAQLANVELRLLAVLWHLAEDWGVVGSQGTVLAFPLTHETLGRFVGAQRPTVSLALKKLDGEGLVHRLEDGSWLLAHGSDDELRTMLVTDVPATYRGAALRAKAVGDRATAVESRSRARELVEAASALQAQAAQIQRRLRERRFGR